jgi:ribosome-associated translation inhibitor RaiA
MHTLTLASQPPRFDFDSQTLFNEPGIHMHIQINTDDSIQCNPTLTELVSATVEHALKHHQDQITRVEVHLADENAGKHGLRDSRCMLEARLEGRQPVSAKAFEATLPQAVKSAADKLARVLDTQMGRVSRVHANPAPSQDGVVEG